MTSRSLPNHLSDWKVVLAQAVGSSHLRSGLPCQDAVDWHRLPSGLLAVALADGAGSAPLAEIGAKLAVYAALHTLQEDPVNQVTSDIHAWGRAILAAFTAAHATILNEATASGMPASDYATTLICLVAGRDGIVLGQVGDGVVVACTPDGDLYTLTRPQRGEYANETLFLTTPEAITQGYFQAFELELAGLTVFSDGLIRLALQLPDYEPYAPFFAPLWQFAARSKDDGSSNHRLMEFLSSERVCSRTEDDKSLLVAVLNEFDFHPVASDSLEA